MIRELRPWKLPSGWMSSTQHLQSWGAVDDSSCVKGSIQDKRWSYLEVTVLHWHLVSTAIRTTWAKSRRGTTCSHLARAVFNYTWYRHYSSEWSHPRKEEKSRVGAALQGQGRRVLGWNNEEISKKWEIKWDLFLLPTDALTFKIFFQVLNSKWCRQIHLCQILLNADHRSKRTHKGDRMVN